MSSPTSTDNASVTAVVDESEEKSVVLEEITPIIEENSTDVVKDAVNETVTETVTDVVSDTVDNVVTSVLNDTVANVVSDVVTDVAVEVAVNVAEKVVDKVFDDLLEKLNIKIGSLEITPQTVMTVVRFAMEVVELSELKGEEQKIMVLRLLKHVITVAPISDEKEALCLQMIEDGVVGNTIDIIVAATQGKLEINQIVENVVDIATNTGCCGLFSFLHLRTFKTPT